MENWYIVVQEQQCRQCSLIREATQVRLANALHRPQRGWNAWRSLSLLGLQRVLTLLQQTA